MSLLTKMYEQCAKDCVREAERTADPKYREQLHARVGRSGRARSIDAIEAAEKAAPRSLR